MANITVYDTTLRDGAQGEGVSLSLQDKLAIAHRLDELGVHYIEAGYPGSNPKDEAVFEGLAQDLGKVASGLGEASHEKVTGHHAEIVREQFSKAVSTAQVAANSLIRNLQKKADEWDPDGAE